MAQPAVAKALAERPSLTLTRRFRASPEKVWAAWTDPEKLIAATEGLSMGSPFGDITFRKIDHQSTLGAFVGKTALKDGKGIMVDTAYKKGADFLPSDAEVEKLRPKD